ncbi:MAG: OprD family outer membrane porin [Burkholderiales bacterium]
MDSNSRRKLGSIASACVLAVLSAIASGPALSEYIEDVESAPVRERALTVHLRTYYLDRKLPGPQQREAWAGGGWFTYDSGWFSNLLRVGLSGATSQPIHAPGDKDGTLLLAPGQQGYSVLGQAYGVLKLWDQIFTGYRQGFSQPEVNWQDNRMTPNTFEGYTLAGKVLGVDYFGGYLDKMKTRNADIFRDFATVAGAPPGIKEAMWLGGLSFSPINDATLRLSNYHVPNILTSTYADASWLATLSEEYKLRLGGQYMYQSSTGEDLLTGSSFHTWSGGAKADLIRGPATLSFAYTQTGRGAAYRTPYGSWAGYTSMIVEDFNQAGERAWLIGGAFDFVKLKVPGLVINAAAVFGRDSINPATGAGIANTDEYDLTIDYRFDSGNWPEWLKPLWIRGRAARIEQTLGGNTDVTKDYRIIVNYKWVFKWTKYPWE